MKPNYKIMSVTRFASFVDKMGQFLLREDFLLIR